MFHRVVKDVRIAGIEISEESFKSLIDYLKEEFEIVSLNSISKSEKRCAILTFDDGYKDNYTFVYPYLTERNIPFTIYITTDFLDKKAILWWYLLKDLGKDELVKSIRNGEIEPEELFRENGVSPEQYVEETLNWEELKEMSRSSLVTIGGHTTSHPNLRLLESSGVEFEIGVSKQRLEEELEIPIEHFAYPYGGKSEADEVTYSITEKFGFKTAVTTVEDNVRDQQSIALPRIPISGNSSLGDIKVRLSGIFSLKNYLR
jgi:peptidoglycan/xylan/chitin deacetylase (PgdA/CDA1 family)